MIEGHLKIAALNNAFYVLFFPQDGRGGGPVKAHPIHDVSDLKSFMELLGCPLSPQQLLDAGQAGPIGSTPETKHASISLTLYKRYFG
ncbi:MAG TPA: hypothetical protein VE959_27890 [Bryobacteraceae bacterium]|nr:hypothetical protein [Bryobacteraceae bacterium]